MKKPNFLKKNFKEIILIVLLIIIIIIIILETKNIISDTIMYTIFISSLLIYVSIAKILRIFYLKKILKKEKIFKEFHNQTEVTEWAIKCYSKSQLKIIESYYPQNANDPYNIGSYKGNEYWIYNDRPYDEKSKILNEYLNKFTINENIIAYRFCDKVEYKKLSTYKRNYIKRFLSTTLLPDLFDKYKVERRKMIKILIPKSSKGLFLPDKAQNDIETEILLPNDIALTYIGKSKKNKKKLKPTYWNNKFRRRNLYGAT